MRSIRVRAWLGSVSLLASVLAFAVVAQPGLASAQSMFYGFEGDGWQQSADKLILTGNARIDTNPATAFAGQSAAYFYQGLSPAGFYKAVPTPPQNRASVCHISWKQQSSLNGQDRVALHLHFVEPAGRTFYSTQIQLRESQRWEEQSLTIHLSAELASQFDDEVGLILGLEPIGPGNRAPAWTRVDNLSFWCEPWNG